MRIFLTGLAILVGAAVAGYGLGVVVERRPGLLRTQTVQQALSPTASPTAAPSSSSPSPKPYVAPRATTRPPAPARTAPTPTAPRIVFEWVPERVSPRESFNVRWSVEGSGAKSASTRLKISGSGVASVAGESRSGFSLPARFDGTIGAADRGTLTITAEATVNGKTVTARRTVIVE